LARYPVTLAVRGEDWRGAVDWVRDQAESDDRIYLESGLIESRAWDLTPSSSDIGEFFGFDESDRPHGFHRSPSTQTRAQMEFLCYPVRGPYRLSRFELVNADLDLPLNVLYDVRRQIFLIVRRKASQIEINATKWGWVHGNRMPSDLKSFGGVTVIAFSAEDDSME
jgi:hypothetical protein